VRLAIWPLLFALQAAATLETPWYEHYDRGVGLVGQGAGAAARAELEQALAQRPEEGLGLPTGGTRYLDYLPHLYLAVACHMTGDLAAARRHLGEAESSGLAARSPAGAPLLAAYQALLGAGRPEEPPRSVDRPSATAGYKLFPRKAPALSDVKYNRVRAAVLSRCHLSRGADASNAPWYYYYELGLELVRHGDSQRALDSFIEAADRRSQPERLARTYGMWFVDYLPYLQITRAHARLGNRECALNALALSHRLGEITDAERAEMKEMIDKVDR
jgi:hypothetical protein